MIALSPSLAAVYLLSFWTIGCTTGCDQGQAMAQGRCCDACPPGKHMTAFCSEEHQTLCSPCEDGYYSSQHTTFDRCEKCHSCQQKYEEKCTSTTNAKCSCHSGFLCSTNICSKCVADRCVAGEKAKMTVASSGQGLVQYSYLCEPLCPDSEYFDVKEGICKPRAQCSFLGLAEQFPGNTTHNAVCEGADRQKQGGPVTHMILVMCCVLLCIALLAFLSRACIKNIKKRKPCDNPINVAAVSSSAPNFHLSKEESGLQLIIQVESKYGDSLDPLDVEKVKTFP
ncbi:tumor necrosis factor receptor superfamily member 18 [Brachionichthys hirsutus]|uniref:tumor necrosis factor receptor superfamily member 18 n=1 Tax=Brachionichthys hirsutus TaxID=412623 RepID=UPI00360434ED